MLSGGTISLPDKIEGDRWLTPYCSFCGKSQQEVGGLVAGPKNVFICNECTDLCAEMFADRRGIEPEINRPQLSLKERLAIFRKGQEPRE